MSQASIKDVAAHAGLSVGTVSNVLNHPDKVSEATRAKVLRSIEELGFVRNEAARQLRAGTSQCVGFVVLDAANPFFHDIAAGVEESADAANLQLLLANSGSDPDREARHLALFDQQRVKGLLVSPVRGVSAVLERLARRGMPTVLVDIDSSGGAYSSVSVDDVAGGRMATRHLIDQGHTKLCYVGGPPLTLRQDADRFIGASEEVAEHVGVSLEHVSVSRHHLEGGRSAADRVLARPERDRPTAVFCANDLLALGFLQGVIAAGLRVPDDLGLVGYDDISFAAGASVPLSSVRQPSHELGQQAMALLMEQIDDPEVTRSNVVLQPELVVRESSALRR
ncbi:LacI family DNA-binding transcriptional regulator [Aestuariimicrobium ganziense]|uniref:LacI family DNA-binding transcriptional regulator n=1 Tax=Aestuariimicrobium ganziense TaxID=2773677 RepID=UPI0019448291|nr:LacI family DNA-binding transcriptional regulator [Aestuariimicrobium ganziense]